MIRQWGLMHAENWFRVRGYRVWITRFGNLSGGHLGGEAHKPVLEWRPTFAAASGQSCHAIDCSISNPPVQFGPLAKIGAFRSARAGRSYGSGAEPTAMGASP